MTFEDELWDDANANHPPVLHTGCWGRVVLVCDDEWRCFGCGEQVEAPRMTFIGEIES